MPIKIFLKHLFTSIKRRPAQPLLLVIIIALAVSLCTIAFNAKQYLLDDERISQEASFGNADFAVSLSSTADTRFLFENDVEKVLSQDDETCGVYGLPVFYNGNDFVYGVATDYTKFTKMFNLTLLDTKPLYDKDVKSSIYITKEFASKYDLEVGDEIEISILNVNKKYTIYGISQYLFAGAYSVMMDVSSAVDLLASSSLTIAMLDDQFIPSSKVFVNAAGNADVAMNKIRDEFTDVSLVAPVSLGALATNLNAIVLLIVLITVFFSFAVIYCCFSIITNQRKEENALFYIAGAKGYMLNILSLIEMFIYWLVGSIVGTLLAMPLSTLYITLSKFEYVTMYMTPWISAVSCVIALAASLGSMMCFILLDKKAKKKTKINTKTTDKTFILICLTLIIAMIVVVCVSAADVMVLKRIFGMISYFVTLTAALFTTKLLFTKGAKSLSKVKKFSVPLQYALKNSHRVSSNQNTTSVISMFFIVTITMIFVISISIKSITYIEDAIQGDFLVQNVSDSSLENLDDIEGVERVSRLLYDSIGYKDEEGDHELILFSATDPKIFNKYLCIEKMPEGNEAIITKSMSLSFGVDIGDEMEVIIAEKPYTFKIVGLMKMNENGFVINAKDMGLSYNYVAIKTADGYDKEVVQERIANALILDNAVIIAKEKMMESSERVSLTYLVFSEYVTVFLVLFALIGIIDSIVASYISRKNEFVCFKSAGMNKKSIARLVAAEIGYSVVIAAVIFLLFFPFSFMSTFDILYGYHIYFFYPYQYLIW